METGLISVGFESLAVAFSCLLGSDAMLEYYVVFDVIRVLHRDERIENAPGLPLGVSRLPSGFL